MMRNVIRFKATIITMIVLTIVLCLHVNVSFADDESVGTKGTLKILDSVPITHTFVSGIGVKLYTNENLDAEETELSDTQFFYVGRDQTSTSYTSCKIAAIPYNESAKITVYATGGQRYNDADAELFDFLTGKSLQDKIESYHYGSEDAIDVITTHWYYNSTRNPIMFFRIEVVDDDVTNNYNFALAAKSTNATSLLTNGKNKALDVINNHTDVSPFSDSVKAIVGVAKTHYASLINNATTLEEVCLCANEFNIIVCQAKAIEDEYTDLNDELHDAEEALSEISDTVTGNADESVAAAEALDLTKYSEEDAAAITEALTALETELASEDATTASINEATEALNSAVNTAKQNALQKAKENAESALETANGQLEQAQNDLNAANGQITDLNTQLEGTKAELETAKAELEAAKEEIEKVSKVDKVKAVSAKAGKKKVTVKWKKVAGVKGYVIYRSLKKKSGYTEVKTIKKAGTVKFTDKKVKKGKKYFYKIRAYKDYNGNQLFGAYSKVLKTAKVK